MSYRINYVNVGDCETRSWEDMVEYGFISAGQGRKYSKPLESLRTDDIVLMYLKGSGYVGVGKVVTTAVPILEFRCIDGERISQKNLKNRGLLTNSKDTELSEWLVAVEWIKTVDRNEGKWEKATAGKEKLYSTPLIRASMENQSRTIDFLNREFQLDIYELASINKQPNLQTQESENKEMANKVGVLCLDWDDEEITLPTDTGPKIIYIGFFTDSNNYDEFPDELPNWVFNGFVTTGNNGDGFYNGWCVESQFFTEEIETLDDGEFPDEFLENTYPKEMEKIKDFISYYSGFHEDFGDGFPKGSQLKENDIDEPDEQFYLVNEIEDENRLILQYIEKVADIEIEMPEEIFSNQFVFEIYDN